jgi:hypothetical protein
MGHDQWNPAKQSVTLEMARAAGQTHGETAFTAMVSCEIFVESLNSPLTKSSAADSI